MSGVPARGGGIDHERGIRTNGPHREAALAILPDIARDLAVIKSAVDRLLHRVDMVDARI